MKDNRTTGITAYTLFSAADIKEAMKAGINEKIRVITGFGYIQLADFAGLTELKANRIEDPLKHLYDVTPIGVYERDGSINAVAIREPRTKAVECRPQGFAFCWLGDLHASQDSGKENGLFSNIPLPSYVQSTKFLGVCAGFAVLQITAYEYRLLPSKQQNDINTGFLFLHSCEQKGKEPLF